MSDFRFVPVEDLEGRPAADHRTVRHERQRQDLQRPAASPSHRPPARRRGLPPSTPRGRMKKYRRQPRFTPSCIRSSPCAGPRRSTETGRSRRAKRLIKAGAACVILDSASDEWEGEGGVLQEHDAYLDRVAERGSQPSATGRTWRAGRARRNRTSTGTLSSAWPRRADHPLPPRPAEDQDDRWEGDRPRRPA